MKKILLGGLFFAYMQISLAQLRVDANSQLHIGGTSPTERLDVNGAIRIGTTANTNAGTIRYLSNVFEGYNGTAWVDLSSPSKWTLTGNNIYFNTGKVGIGGAPATAFEIKDNGSRMRFQRSSAIDGIVIGDSEQNFAIATRVQGAAAIPINSYLFFNHSLGNFGVNTLSPTTDFHIQGDFRLTGGFYDSFVSTGSIGQILTSTITGTKWTNLSELGQWLESGSNLYTLGNVGIGTTTPVALLDVNGDALISSIDIGKGNNELSDNTVFGVLAGTAITTGNYNTFIGKNTGIANTTGEKNTFFGRQAGYSNITGSNNVFIGHQAGYNETGSDKLYIDNSSTSTPLIGGDFSTNTLTITGDIEYTGTLTDVSDRRLKKDIEPLKNSLEKILKINPVSFKMKADEKGRTQLGVIAQNVKEHFPQVVSIIDPVNGFLGVDYTQLVAPLIGAMKAQQAQIEQLQKDIKKLKKRK